MTDWWNNLETVTRCFYGAAFFFSVFFVWQLIAMFTGISGAGEDTDVVVGGDAGHAGMESGPHSDAIETAMAFKLISVRSLLTFCMLFTWGTALYLDRGCSLATAMGIATVWGLAGMVTIASLVYGMHKLQATGNKNVATCVGTTGAVYLNIPGSGTGEVRVMVSGQMSHVKARTADGHPLTQGTPVKVIRLLGPGVVEVERV